MCKIYLLQFLLRYGSEASPNFQQFFHSKKKLAKPQAKSELNLYLLRQIISTHERCMYAPCLSTCESQFCCLKHQFKIIIKKRLVFPPITFNVYTTMYRMSRALEAEHNISNKKL